MNSAGFEDTTDPPRKRATVLVVSGVILLATILGIWAIVFGLILIERREPTIPTPAAEDHYPVDRPEAIRRAREAWERFVEATDFDSRVDAVRDADRVRPMMEDLHLERRAPFPTMARISQGQPVNQGSRRMVFFEVEDFRGRSYPVAVEWTGDRFAVDWESLTAYGTIDWPALLGRQPRDLQTMRLYLSQVRPELVPPLDEKWTFFEIQHRDSPESAVAGASGEVALRLEQIVSPGMRKPLTVEIRWNPEIRQFEIVRLVARGWSL